MGLLQEGGTDGDNPSISERLEKLNAALLQRSEAAGVPLAPIQIGGAGKDPQDQIAAIKEQYNGLVERLAVPPEKLTESTEEKK